MPGTEGHGVVERARDLALPDLVIAVKGLVGLMARRVISTLASGRVSPEQLARASHAFPSPNQVDPVMGALAELSAVNVVVNGKGIRVVALPQTFGQEPSAQILIAGKCGGRLAEPEEVRVAGEYLLSLARQSQQVPSQVPLLRVYEAPGVRGRDCVFSLMGGNVRELNPDEFYEFRGPAALIVLPSEQ